MAQINENQNLAAQTRILRANNVAASAAQGSNSTLLELFVSGYTKLSVQFDVTVANLDAFVVQGRVTQDASYVTLASAAADYTAPSKRILAASGDLTTVASAASGWFDMDVSGLEAVKILASGSGGASTVSIYATATEGGISNSNITLTAGDIEIGAVELKDAATDVRASIVAANTARTTGTIVVATQPIDAAGNVLGRTAANTARTTGTLVDPVQVVDAAGTVLGIGTALTPNAAALTTQRPSVTQVVSTALEASHVLKASAGQLVHLAVLNTKTSTQYILIMNAASLPGDGAVTLLYPPIPIAAGSLMVLDLPAPLVASTGIVVCNSSTGTFTKTIGAADLIIFAQVN